MGSSQVVADTAWMRTLAKDCHGTATAIGKLVHSAAQTTAELRRAAPGWVFLDSLDEMLDRWEDLNKLLRDELEETGDNIQFSASSYDGNENFITEMWHKIIN